VAAPQRRACGRAAPPMATLPRQPRDCSMAERGCMLLGCVQEKCTRAEVAKSKIGLRRAREASGEEGQPADGRQQVSRCARDRSAEARGEWRALGCGARHEKKKQPPRLRAHLPPLPSRRTHTRM
jgi:hypothetical protein